jgi:hypothetical protein
VLLDAKRVPELSPKYKLFSAAPTIAAGRGHAEPAENQFQGAKTGKRRLEQIQSYKCGE